MAGWVNELLCKYQSFNCSFASSFIIDTMLYCYMSFTCAGTRHARGAIAPSIFLEIGKIHFAPPIYLERDKIHFAP